MGALMGKIRTHLLATAALVALSTSVYAADMGMPLKAPPPPPPPVQDWSGVYVGIEGGYGWGKQTINPAFDPFELSDPWFCFKLSGGSANPTVGSTSQSGGVFGAFAGVQKQWGSWVLGLEAEIDGADITGTSNPTNVQSVCLYGGCGSTSSDPKYVTLNQSQTVQAKIDELGFAGPKVGWAFSPNWMIYATGGLAWAHVEETASQSQSVTYCWTYTPPCTGGPGSTLSESGGASMFGWAAGAGLDYKWQLDAGSAIILGVKYLHYGFGNNTITVADNTFGTGLSFGLNTKESVDVVTGRISYLFSIH
jgi:outer membrane immunogenic protein